MSTLGWLITHTFTALFFLLIGQYLGEKKAKMEEKERFESDRFNR